MEPGSLLDVPLLQQVQNCDRIMDTGNGCVDCVSGNREIAMDTLGAVWTCNGWYRIGIFWNTKRYLC